MAESNDDVVIYRSKKEQGNRDPPKRPEGHEQGEEEDINSWLSDYGWIKILKITNNSSNTLKFTNPYEARLDDEIESGQSESTNCVGYLPYTSSLKTYEIKYYNKVFDKWTKLILTDVEQGWLMSTVSVKETKTEEPDEDVREVSPNPESFSDWARLEFIIHDDGYEIYDPTWKDQIARLKWTK